MGNGCYRPVNARPVNARPLPSRSYDNNKILDVAEGFSEVFTVFIGEYSWCGVQRLDMFLRDLYVLFERDARVLGYITENDHILCLELASIDGTHRVRLSVSSKLGDVLECMRNKQLQLEAVLQNTGLSNLPITKKLSEPFYMTFSEPPSPCNSIIEPPHRRAFSAPSSPCTSVGLHTPVFVKKV